MDIINRFSLVDFLAYLFPGIVSTMGLYVLLLLTPLRSSLAALSIDLITGILFLALSYVIGVVLSGFTEIPMKRFRTRKPDSWIKSKIPDSISEFKNELAAAFSTLFDTRTTWSNAHFYLCRSLVLAYMPGLNQMIQRQSSLRQLRMNLIPGITIWTIAGGLWTISIANRNLAVWEYFLVAVSSLVMWLLVVGSIINRMNSNDRREVREVLTAFLAGYAKGEFDRVKSSGPPEAQVVKNQTLLSRIQARLWS